MLGDGTQPEASKIDAGWECLIPDYKLKQQDGQLVKNSLFFPSSKNLFML